MALAVIGAGLGRTGTYSLNLALEMLGFGPCHHMVDVNQSAEQKALWRAAGKGQLPDWDQAYAGFTSAVDWPTAHFWREVSAHFADARVILTVRDPDAWFRSIENTLSHMMGAGNDPEGFGVAVIGQTVFGGRFAERGHAISVLEAHNAAVRDAIAPGRLLVYEVAEGWEPLCTFLGVPVPAEPFPHANTTEQFRAAAGL